MGHTMSITTHVLCRRPWWNRTLVYVTVKGYGVVIYCIPVGGPLIGTSVRSEVPLAGQGRQGRRALYVPRAPAP
jgi:hypothetical protein